MTLVMACAVVEMWSRSYVVLESLEFTFCGMDHSLQAIVGSVCTRHARPPKLLQVTWKSSPLPDIDRRYWMKKGILGYHSDRWLRREWGGFVFSQHGEQPQTQLVFPYWSLALPLTLLSAYLILWKSRKRD